MMGEKWLFRVLAVVTAVWLSGCNSGSSGSDDSATNTPPVAHAGGDTDHLEKLNARASASGSSDADGDPLSYLWEKISGPDVTLSGVENIVVQFDAPPVDQEEVVQLRVTVTDDKGASDSDTVSITIIPSPWVTYRDLGESDLLSQRRQITPDPANGNRVYSSEYEGPLVRADFDASTVTQLLPRVAFYAIDPAAPSQIVASGSTNPDAGRSEYELLESHDAGATWTTFAADRVIASNDTWEHAVFSSDGAALVIYEHDRLSASLPGSGILRSTDDGRTWEEPEGANDQGHGPAAFSVPRPELFYVYGGHTILERSTDYVASLVEVDRRSSYFGCGDDGHVPLPDPFNANKFLTVSVASESSTTDICRPEVRLSDDAGETFTTATLSDYPVAPNRREVSEFDACTSPVTQGVYYIAYMEDRNEAGTHRNQARILKTMDGGLTWEPLVNLRPHMGLPADEFGELAGSTFRMSCGVGPELGQTALYVDAGPDEGVARYLDTN